MQRLDHIVNNVVKEIQQTRLTEDMQLTREQGKQLLTAAYNRVKAQVTADILETVKTVVNDPDRYLVTKIEAAVGELKQARCLDAKKNQAGVTPCPLVRFLTPLDVRIHPCPPPGADPDLCYQQIGPFRVQIGDSEIVESPIGFWSDGGSVPHQLWSVLTIHPMTPRFARGFWLHDLLYATNYKGDRRLCDRILRDAAIVDGAGDCEAGIVYAGVRVGGWGPWEEYRRKSTLELSKSINSFKHNEPMFRMTVAGWNRNLDGLS